MKLKWNQWFKDLKVLQRLMGWEVLYHDRILQCCISEAYVNIRFVWNEDVVFCHKQLRIEEWLLFPEFDTSRLVNIGWKNSIWENRTFQWLLHVCKMTQVKNKNEILKMKEWLLHFKYYIFVEQRAQDPNIVVGNGMLCPTVTLTPFPTPCHLLTKVASCLPSPFSCLRPLAGIRPLDSCSSMSLLTFPWKGKPSSLDWIIYELLYTYYSVWQQIDLFTVLYELLCSSYLNNILQWQKCVRWGENHFTDLNLTIDTTIIHQIAAELDVIVVVQIKVYLVALINSYFLGTLLYESTCLTLTSNICKRHKGFLVPRSLHCCLLQLVILQLLDNLICCSLQSLVFMSDFVVENTCPNKWSLLLTPVFKMDKALQV